MANDLTTHDDSATGSLPSGYEQQESLAVSLARAEIDQQVATSRALPRSIQRAISNINTLATLDEETAADCIYALPRGGKTIRGPSIRFAEIMASQWGNCRVGARVVHVDRIEGYVEAEGVFHDLETNVAQTARVRRTIQAKRGKGIDADMIQLAGAAACSIARRNAILMGIPKGVARKGYLAVESVIRGDIKTLVERRDAAMQVFLKIGVSQERIFAALEVAGVEEITLDHLATLTGAKSALKNGEATIDELFPAPNAGKAPVIKATLSGRLDALAGAGETIDADTGEIKQAAKAHDEETKARENEEAKKSDAGDSSHPHQEAAAEDVGGKPATDTKAEDSAAADNNQTREDGAPADQPDEIFDAGRAAAAAGKSRKNSPLDVRKDTEKLKRWESGFDSHGATL